MRFIGKDYQPLEGDGEDLVNQHYWEYSIKERDFFLMYNPIWYRIDTAIYTLTMNDRDVLVPSDFYVMIADIYLNIDWIKVDEMVGREFEAFTITNQFEKETWFIQPVRITQQHEGTLYYPGTKNPFPITVDDSYAILIAPTDMYNKMKHFEFNDIV